MSYDQPAELRTKKNQEAKETGKTVSIEQAEVMMSDEQSYNQWQIVFFQPGVPTPGAKQNRITSIPKPVGIDPLQILNERENR